MIKLTIDLESRSAVDLKKSGPWRYAEDPTTQIMCFSFKFGSAKSRLWIPDSVRALYGDYIEKFPEIVKWEIIQQLKDADIIEAHNLEFEIALWTHKMVPLGFPDLRESPYFEKLRCSASAAAYRALPRRLGDLSRALDLSVQKDNEGHKIMLKLCKPRHPRKAEREANPDWENTIYYHEDPEDLYKQGLYCLTDTDTEFEASEKLGSLPKSELEIWRIDQKANWLGVTVDIDMCRKMIDLRDDYKDELVLKFRELTGLKPSQTGALAKWCTDNGYPMDSVAADHIVDALEDLNIPADVEEALRMRQFFAKTSLAKLDAAEKGVCSDGRLRSNLMYHGASTGRWSAKGMQLQNLPSRGLIKTIDSCTNMILSGASLATIQVFYENVQLALSSCIRGVLTSTDETDLYAADFSAIEGRVLAWLAGDKHIVDAYVNGQDMYVIAAALVYGVPYEDVTDDQRQVGKIPELGGGYGGGWRAYAGFAKKFRLFPSQEIYDSLTEEDYWDWWLREDERTDINRFSDLEAAYCKWFSPIVRDWRSNRPGTVTLWKGLEEAAIKALQHKGETFSYAGVKYRHWRGFLACQLPSGRVIWYYDPKLMERRGRPQISYMGSDSRKGGRWSRQFTYGGKLCENTIQGIARDVMAAAMVRIGQKLPELNLLFTVHDEIICEGPKGYATAEEFCRVMSEPPAWAAGCPIDADGWVGTRYKK